jgi:tetratricopeptide (TPR) repeat protein
MFVFFDLRGHYEDWVWANETALHIACQIGDRGAQAQAHNDLGVARWRQGRYTEALDCHQQSLAVRRELGDRHGQAESLRELGATLRELGPTPEARAHLSQALAIFEQLQTADADQVRALLADLPMRASS